MLMRDKVNSGSKSPLFAVLFVFFTLSLFSLAEDSPKLTKLAERLESTKTELSAKSKEIASQNREYYRLERSIIYTNGLPAKLYKEVKAMEKDLAVKRKEFQDALYKVPEMKALLAKKNKLYNEFKTIQDSKRLLENEIRAEKFKAGGKRQK